MGKGAYGKVEKAKEIATGKIVAIKTMNYQIENEGIPSVFIREISLLKQLESQYIVKLLDQKIEQQQMYLVFEYFEYDLRKYLMNQKEKISNLQIKSIMFQLLSGVNFMHNCRVMHRDLKPANILVDLKNDQDIHIKIADLGMGRTYCLPIRPYSLEVVTLNYRAPELLLGAQEYSTSIDIWSIGCIFAELVLGQVFFKGDSNLDMIFRICRSLGVPDENSWPGVSNLPLYQEICSKNSNMPNYQQSIDDLKETLNQHQLETYGQDLFFKLLKYDPQQRITAKEALNHPYFYYLIQNQQ